MSEPHSDFVLDAEESGEAPASAGRGSPGPDALQGAPGPAWQDEDDALAPAARVLALTGERQHAAASWATSALAEVAKGKAPEDEAEPAVKRVTVSGLPQGALQILGLPDLTKSDQPRLAVSALSVHPNGQLVAVLSQDWRVRFVHADQRENPMIQCMLFAESKPRRVAFLGDGTRAIVTGNTEVYHVLNFSTGGQTTHSLGMYRPVRISSMQAMVPLIDVASGIPFPPLPELDNLVFFSQAGPMRDSDRTRRRAKRGPFTNPAYARSDVFLLDCAQNAIVRRLQTPFADPSLLCVCGDHLLVSGPGSGGTVLAYKVEVHQYVEGEAPDQNSGIALAAAAPAPEVVVMPPVSIQDAGAVRVTAIAACPRSRLFAVGQDSGVVNVYSLDEALLQTANGAVPTPRAVAKTLKSEITVLGFNPNGEILVAADSEGNSRFVHVRSGTTFSQARNPPRVQAAQFSPSGREVYLGMATGRVLCCGLPYYR